MKSKLNVSVIIPVKNEESTIRDLLDRLLMQTRKADEIVIVDGGSQDKTKDVINNYIVNGAPIKLISLSEAFPGKGRNIAINNATNNIIVSIDAGCEPDIKWIEELIKPFEENDDIDVVNGKLMPNAKTLLQKCIIVATYPSRFRPYVPCMAFKKYVWEKTGGFPEELRTGEDLIFIKKIEKCGFRATYNDKALNYWEPRKNLAQFFNQFYWYSKGMGQRKRELIFHLRKLSFYLFLIFFLYLSFKNRLLSMLVLGAYILWISATVKNHYLWFKEIKKIPKAYFILFIVIIIRDVAAILGFIHGFIVKNKI